MPVRRSRRIPVVSVHRETLLNDHLTPTSRLLYAVLIASLDDDIGLENVAELVGVTGYEELRPYLDELANEGAVDVLEHVGQGMVLTVHEMPLVPSQRTHVCVPCQDCGECSCQYTKGLCQACHNIRHTYDNAHADIARWKAQLAAGATYAVGQSATRLHRWDCPTLSTPEQRLARLEETKPYAAQGGFYWSKMPQLYTAEELRKKATRKKNCATCGPDPL